MGAKALHAAPAAQLQAAATPRPAGRQFFGIVQMVNKEIGKIDHTGQHPAGVIDRARVVAELGTINTLSWPTDPANTFFNPQNYGGAVSRALEWGLAGGEGTSGWTGREYAPADFHTLANNAFAAILGLNNAALDNESNKTLIAIRAFRGGAGAGMANRTLQDLQAVLLGVNNQRANLAAALLIPNALDNIVEVKADPAEAHPGTLPTARITFGSGQRIYFKGRSGAVEDALVGTNNSAAQAISQLGAVTPGSETGTHTFVSEQHTHSSGDVGAPAPHGPATNEEVISAWVSAARTAALVSLTGTADLHDSNVINSAGATKHIIDAEFLLDATAWAQYEQAAHNNEIPNFEMSSMAPQWVIDQTHQKSPKRKRQISNKVAARFAAMGLNNDNTLEQILAPIRALIANEVLLRISPMPFITSFWLSKIRDYHNEADKDQFMEDRWNELVIVYPTDFHIRLMNKNNVKARLRANFDNGEVPLFHIGASTGTFYLNKDTLLGRVDDDRSTERFLELTKLAMINGYNNMVDEVRNAVRNA
jgi:hypothetical protein